MNPEYDLQKQTFPGSQLTAEKSFVLLDGPAEGNTKLVSFEFIAHRLEEVPSVNDAIANEFKHGAVILVGSGLRHNTDHCARSEAVL